MIPWLPNENSGRWYGNDYGRKRKQANRHIEHKYSSQKADACNGDF